MTKMRRKHLLLEAVFIKNSASCGRQWKNSKTSWREDQQLQKPPGGLSIKHEDCGSLSVTHTASYTHLYPDYRQELFQRLQELHFVSY